MQLFCLFNFERNYDVSKSKNPSFLLNKKVNFNKNETGSIIENPSHAFRETNLVLQPILESRIKYKSVIIWSSRTKKECIFSRVYILSQCVEYWINFQNIFTFAYQKTQFYTLFCLFLKYSKASSVPLKVSSTPILSLINNSIYQNLNQI